MQATDEKRWYLVQCKPRQDFRAFENLQNQGYECLLPTQKVERLRNGQWSHQEEPLFPGYLFIELDTLQDNWVPIRSTRGVSKIVSFGSHPLSVSESVISRLRIIQPAPPTAIKAGDQVRVSYQDSDYLEAIFVAKDGTERVLILLTLMHREIKVSIPTENLRTTK